MDIAKVDSLQAIFTAREQALTLAAATQGAQEVNPYKINKDAYEQVESWLRGNYTVFPALASLFSKFNGVVQTIGESYPARQDEMRSKFLRAAYRTLKQLSPVPIETTIGSGYKYKPGSNGGPSLGDQFYETSSKRWIHPKSGERTTWRDFE